MQVTPTTYTIAEFCGQLQRGEITINREYQRSPKVWPPAARSYLIDTILHGYPIPKLCLYQKTDLKSRKTIKEIVDGQQRSQAILDFFVDKLRLSGKTEFSGMTFSTLEEPLQRQFVEYPLSADVFVGAAETEIRQVFRRINSYTVPLNPQEKRHATHQGAFKWFIVALGEQYAQSLKSMGVFSEANLSRMADHSLFTEITLAILAGIQSASEAKLDGLYTGNEASFPEQAQVEHRFEQAMGTLFGWEQIHSTALMKPYNFYTCFLALTHAQQPVLALQELAPAAEPLPLNPEIALANLGTLAAALVDEEPNVAVSPFVAACAKATNRLEPRRVRFRWFFRALGPELI